jgi:hypothetical protein
MRDGLRKYLQFNRLEWGAIFTVGLVAALLTGMILFHFGKSTGLEAATSPIDETTAINGSEIAGIDASQVQDPKSVISDETNRTPQSTGLEGNNLNGSQNNSSQQPQQTQSSSNQNIAAANGASSGNQNPPPPVAENDEYIHVNLTIDNGVRTLEYPMEVEKDCTVFELLEGASSTYGFSFNYSNNSSYGVFVEELDGVSNSPGSSNYWMYYLNGSLASLGASSQTISNGDAILWRFEATF